MEPTRSGGRGATAAKKSLRVFLVEDSRLIREILEEGLTTSGHISIVGYADTEAGAIPALHDSPCDAIILDLHLKQGNGLSVLRSIRAEHPGTKPVVIIFTNFATPRYREMSMRWGANHFFDKSRDFDRVRDVLEELAGADSN